MKSVLALAGILLATNTQAICPYAERALKDPKFLAQHLEKRDAYHAKEEKRQSGAGNIPFTTFNENQLIDVTGQYEWVAPGPGDVRLFALL